MESLVEILKPFAFTVRINKSLFPEETSGKILKIILVDIFEVISRKILGETLEEYQEEFQKHSQEKSLQE